jgi:hypothetical protein
VTISEQRKYDQFLKETGNETEAMHFWLRWKCQTDLYFLGSEIFGLKNAKDPKRRKNRLDPHIHKMLAHELCMPGSKLILYPRLHMKSTWVKFRICQLILCDPNVRIGLWSKTSRLARKELVSVRNFMAYPIIRELFPETIPDPGKDFTRWQKCTDMELTIWRDPEGYQPQENQLEAWGADSTVTGNHYDYHFYDDIIDQRSVKTAEQIEKTLAWWREMQNIKDLSAEECMTGTRKHQMDIYNTIIREKHFETIVQHKAIEMGKPFYAFFTMRDLEKLKSALGPYTFSLEMMNDPMPDEEKLFRSPFPIYHEIPKDGDDPIELKNYLMVDFSYTEKRWSNWTGICVGSVPVKTHDRIYYREAFRVKKPTDQVAQIIVDMIVKWKPRKCGIESSMMSAIMYILDIKLKEWETKNNRMIRPEFVAIPQKVGNMSKADKIDATLGAFVRTQRALFLPSMGELFNQMEFFNKHSDKNDDDILDAASMLIYLPENFASAHWLRDPGTLPSANLSLDSLRKPKNDGGWEKLWAS